MSTILALLVVPLALSACGGGTDESPSPERDRALIAAARAGDARALIEAGADVSTSTSPTPEA